jgi:orotidine-5'-phosphate decarboxylase
MKLSLKVSLIVGMLVLSNITAALVSEMIHARLKVLQKPANRAQTKTMDFETRKAAPVEEISRIAGDGFALVYPGGRASRLKGGPSPDLSPGVEAVV